MRVLLFGGTFDPPHNGHIHLLQQAIRAVAPDWVVVMPACLPPHKSPSTTAPDLRLAMCRCFEPIFPDLEVSSWEIEQGGAVADLLVWAEADSQRGVRKLGMGNESRNEGHDLGDAGFVVGSQQRATV